MAVSQEQLSRWQAIASIVSSIAIPVVLAVIGYIVQDNLSTAGIKKDYVQIAAGILKESGVPADSELRKWAVTVLDENSPIPFSKEAKLRLEKGLVYIPVAVTCPRFPEIPDAFMKAPQKLEPLPDKGPLTSGDLLKTVVKNFGICNENAMQLEYLQILLRKLQQIDQEFGAKRESGTKGAGKASP